MGIGSFPGGKEAGACEMTTHHLAPRLKEEYSYTSAPSLGLHGLFQGELHVYRFTYLNWGW